MIDVVGVDAEGLFELCWPLIGWSVFGEVSCRLFLPTQQLVLWSDRLLESLFKLECTWPIVFSLSD